MPDAYAAESILVVDDEPQLRELLVDALNRPGLRVYAAGSGSQAMELAQRHRPSLLVMDLLLGDCSGLELMDRLRHAHKDLPTVVITGCHDPDTLSQARQRRPVELMAKPLDLDRLRSTVAGELARLARQSILQRRHQRLRRLARAIRRRRQEQAPPASPAHVELGRACQELNTRVAHQKLLLEYQQSLLSARTDDDVFRSFFSLFARKSGAVFGVANVCDADAQLQVVGRFGVPLPDNQAFSQRLVKPIIDLVLAEPRCQIVDAYERRADFEPVIHRYLPGVSILVMPLIPKPGELIGLVTLYRKGEQPFLRSDLDLAELLMQPTAVAVQRND
jgi:DNA-binding response OmpR family regulator